MKMRLLAAVSAGAMLLIAACSTTDEAFEDQFAEAEESDTVIVTAQKMQGPQPGSMAFASVARPMMAPPPEPAITEQYEETDPNPVKLTSEEPVSTFSSDVDTTAYSVMRRYISSNNMLPPSDSVRVEEYVNYFDYQYTEPKSADAPFTPTVWVTPSPWNAGTRLMHIGVKGFDLQPTETPDTNIVLLLDVSGSMQADNKLPLVKKSVELLVDEMSKDDRISIVVYAGAAGVVLEPTPGNKKTKIMEALNALEAGGSTAGGEGLSLAYKLAEENFADDKVNRIILATDGDFNVGVIDADSLEDFVARKRKSGIYLTVLGFGEGNYNDVIAQKLAQAGNGVAAYIDTLNEARKVLVREFRSTLFPIAKDLKFQVEFNPTVVAEYRLIGYETRLLNREDFNNDAIDAGDIGSGHTVTALYELALAGSDARLIDDRRYGAAPAVSGKTDEVAFVRLRYKLPEEEDSRLIETPVATADAFSSLDKAPADARFAAAVAAFGQKLQRAGYTDRYSYEEIIALAHDAKGDDPFGDRAEFINLVRAAAKIDKEKS
ncbi:von Willebrand factor type A domain-containing protein [Marinicaulis aureus]|uniref:von Willebrand factor type A domain-containing protein n=1 Tax=Hyphococcus aureus TaxID=2666033 RepID=A0ABW1KWY6_9PROT